MDDLTYLDDLLLVGKSKLLGYLPLSTIIDLCGKDPLNLQEELNRNGLSTRLFTHEECGVGSGALYAWDNAKLSALLSLPGNEATLLEAEWPTDPAEFVDRVANDFAEGSGPLYDLIAIAFNDPRDEYRDRWKQDSAESNDG